MSAAPSLEAVRAVIVELFGNKHDQAPASARLEDLGIDSLDRVELEMACEDTFGFRFQSDADGLAMGENVTTIADVQRVVGEQLAAKAAA